MREFSNRYLYNLVKKFIFDNLFLNRNIKNEEKLLENMTDNMHKSENYICFMNHRAKNDIVILILKYLNQRSFKSSI